MRKLISKDLIQNKFNFMIWIPMITVMLGFYEYRGMPLGLYLAMGSLLLAFVPVVGLAQEDKFRVLILNRSLPVAADTIVKSKYVGAWLIAVAGWLYVVALGLLVSSSSRGSGDYFTPDKLMLCLSIVTIVVAGLFPFTLRFGFMGVMVLLVVLQMLGAAVLLTGALLPDAINIRIVIRAVMTGLPKLREALGPAGLFAAVLVMLAAVNVASYEVSKRLFRNREF